MSRHSTVGGARAALRSAWPLAVVAALVAFGGAGCGGDDGPGGGNGADGATSGDTQGLDSGGDVGTGNGGDAGGGTGVDAGGGATAPWWTCPVVSGQPPQRAAGCEAPDQGSYGCKRAFTGFSHEGQSFTCNRCGGGDPKAQGAWRAIAFDSEDPDKPLSNGFRELLVVDGNTWHLRSSAVEAGVTKEVRVDGWYFCADAVELKSQRLVFVATSVTPNNTLGWYAPDVFTGELLTKDGNLLAWGMNAGFEKDWLGYANYCRVGDLIGGKACKDPFEAP